MHSLRSAAPLTPVDGTTVVAVSVLFGGNISRQPSHLATDLVDDPGDDPGAGRLLAYGDSGWG